METIMPDIEVMFVESPNGPAGSGEAFNQLEQRLEGLKGRKFYGTFLYSTGQYRACAAVQDAEEARRLGFATWTIAGGLYAREKLENWTEQASEIPDLFGKMAREYEGRIDSGRPSIEFYKSQRELILLLPILPE